MDSGIYLLQKVFCWIFLTTLATAITTLFLSLLVFQFPAGLFALGLVLVFYVSIKAKKGKKCFD